MKLWPFNRRSTIYPVLVDDEVAKAVSALPTPQDGKSVTAEDIRPLIAELVSAALTDAVVKVS